MNLPPANTPLVSDAGSPVTAFGALAGQLVLSAILGVVVAIVVAGLWGALAYFTDSIFLYAAIFAGIAIGGAMLWPLGKANTLLRIGVLIVAAGLTILAVLSGDFLYLALRVADRTGVNLLDAAFLVAPDFIEAEAEDGVMSVLFGLLGAASTFLRRGRR